jgi:hypothetical protein
MKHTKKAPAPAGRVLFQPVLYSKRTAGQVFNSMLPYTETLPFTVTRLSGAVVQFDCQDEATAETVKEALINILGGPFSISYQLF